MKAEDSVKTELRRNTPAGKKPPRLRSIDIAICATIDQLNERINRTNRVVDGLDSRRDQE